MRNADYNFLEAQMHYDEAAQASRYKRAIRVSGQYEFECYDDSATGFLLLVLMSGGGYRASRKRGRGSILKTDWEPMTAEEMNAGVEAFKAEQEGRELVISQPWSEAITASPVRRCFRYTQKHRLMIRDETRITWEQISSRQLSLLSGPFREYDGWMPMPADHPLAMLSLIDTGNRSIMLMQDISITEVAKEADFNSDETDTTGGWVDDEDEDEPLVIVPPKKRFKKSRYKNPDAPKANVSQETIDANVKVLDIYRQSLEHVAASDKGKIVDAMLKLGASISWHLREDRSKY